MSDTNNAPVAQINDAVSEPTFVASPSVFVGRNSEVCRRSVDGSVTYEEFFGGQVICPTCRGAGRISRETDQELMALIPFSDKRLKPRRTVQYVLVAISVCILIGGLLLYFLFPRMVTLLSDQPTLVPRYENINVTTGVLRMTLVNVYNISNKNFFSVQLSLLEVTMKYGEQIIAVDTNDTEITIPMRSTVPHYITINATFSESISYVARECSKHIISMMIPFQATITLQYFGKSEQNTLNTYQYVQCGNKVGTNRISTFKAAIASSSS